MVDSIEDSGKTIVGLKSQIKEAKIAKKNLASQLQAKDEICQKQNLEIISLKEDLDKASAELKIRVKFEKGTMILDDILSVQRSPKDKYGLGYISMVDSQ